MYHKTLSYYSTIFYRSFSAFTGEQLQAVGLNFGLLFFVIYVGKHPGCSPSELTKALYLDWGYSQRSLNKLAADGFLSREKHGRSYTLTLTDSVFHLGRYPPGQPERYRKRPAAGPFTKSSRRDARTCMKLFLAP